ncbi:MAG: hypothetical protein ACPL1K_02330 [Candidatus Kryptoniota bacterium]
MKNNQYSWRILSGLIVFMGVAILIYGLNLFTHPYILIQWTTATEFDTAGFNLYRKEIPQGSNQIINPTLIPAAGASLQGSSYQYKDARIVPGKTYQYQLEDIDLNGQSTLHDPIIVKADRNGMLEGLIGLVLIMIGILMIRHKQHVPRIE